MDKAKNVYYTVLLQIANVFIYGRLWVALCVFCFVQSSFALFKNSFAISPYAVLMALGSYLLYIVPFIYFGLKREKRASNPRQIWIEERLRRLFWTGGAVMALLLILVLFFEGYFYTLIETSVKGFAIALLALLYMLPVIPYKGRFFALRQIGWLKPIMLAFVWWYMGAYLIAIARESCIVEHPPIAHYWVLGLQFLFLLVLCVLFDIRDYDNDEENGIKTWPVLMGISVTQKLLGFTCILCVSTVIFFPIEGNIKFTYAVLFSVLFLYTTRKLAKYPWWFYDVAVDGLMIAQWGLLAYPQFATT